MARLCIRSSVVSAVGDRHGLADSISARPIPGVKKCRCTLQVRLLASLWSLHCLILGWPLLLQKEPVRIYQSILEAPVPFSTPLLSACHLPARHHGSAPGRRRQQHAIFSAADNRLQAVHAKGFPIAGASKSFRQSEGPGTRGARKPSAASALAREACQP